MFGIAILRRGNARPQVTAEQVAAVTRRHDGPKVRAKRPAVLGLFVPAKGRKVSPFYGLPIVPSAIVNNAAALVCDGPDGTDVAFGESWVARCGFIVPADCLGKYRESGLASVDDANSARNSLRLWVEQNMGPMVSMDDVSIVHYKLH